MTGEAAPAVSIVVLAAGTSSRLGRPKQLLELGGEPLLRHTIRHALASSAAEVVLVLGNRAEEIATAIGDFGQPVVVNPSFAEGQSTSLVAGVRAIDPKADALIVMLGDQPTVGPDLLRRLIDRFRETGAPIVQPRYEGTPGNPVLFRGDLFPELLTVAGDRGARDIIRRRASDVSYIDAGQAMPPDVDSEEDYARLVAAWNAGR